MPSTETTTEPQLNLLSVDVEDYFQVEAFARYVRRDSWSDLPSRVEANTHRVLDLLAEFDAKATFFVVGWIAEKFPRLVREIAERGHEIACHSHLHRHIGTLTAASFREDTRRAIAAISDACGYRVRGYRAPTFSIGQNTTWAVPVLIEEGFTYDSSVFPIRHDLYGMPQAPATPFRWKLRTSGSLIEIPPTTCEWLGRRLPAAGGGYLRILPFWFTALALRQVGSAAAPLVVYFHPWELDPEQPRIPAGWKSRMRHYTGLARMETKLRRLLAMRRFITFGEFAATHRPATAVTLEHRLTTQTLVTFARAGRA